MFPLGVGYQIHTESSRGRFVFRNGSVRAASVSASSLRPTANGPVGVASCRVWPRTIALPPTATMTTTRSVATKMPRPFAILRIKTGPSPRFNSARQPAHNEPARCPRLTGPGSGSREGFPGYSSVLPAPGIRPGFDSCVISFSFTWQGKPRLAWPVPIATPIRRPRAPSTPASPGSAALQRSFAIQAVLRKAQTSG